MKVILILLLLLIDPTGNKKATEANKAYNNGNYAKAEELYRAALKQDPNDPKLLFNLGNALAKQQKFNQALAAYDQARSEARANEGKSRSEYNMGNVFADNKKWDKALESYKHALQANPDDPEAKYNYELAYNKMRRQQQKQNQQQQQNNKNKNKNKNQKQNSQGQQNKKNQNNKNQQQPQGGQNQQNNNKQQSQQQQQNGQMTKQEAKKILDALSDQEKQVLKDLKKAKHQSDKTNAKDW